MRFGMSIKDVRRANRHAGDASALRMMNIAAVLHLLYSAQQTPATSSETTGDHRFTVTEIARATGVSRPTAEDAVDALIAEGWLAEGAPTVKHGRRQAGRPARRIWFDSQAGCVVGVDFAPHWVRALIADLAGTIIGQAYYPVTEKAPATDRVAAARTAIGEALRLAGREHSQILAAAAATVGIARADGQIVRSILSHLVGQNLAEMLGEFLPVPVQVVNDMRAAVLAEYWVGAAAGSSSAVYLHAGLRLGTAYLIDGVSPLGFNGAAGEIPPDSGNRLIDAHRELVSFTGVNIDSLTPEEIRGIDPQTVFEDAARGVEGARQAVIAFAEALAAAIEGLVITVDPEVVVVGGGAVVAGAVVSEAVQSRLAGVCLFEPRVALSPLGESAAAIGAVRLALDKVEHMLFANPSARRQDTKLVKDITPAQNIEEEVG